MHLYQALESKVAINYGLCAFLLLPLTWLFNLEILREKKKIF